MRNSPDPHAARSRLETSLCAEMRAQGVAHEHRSLHFRVRLASGDQVKYDPALITRRGPIMFLIEPLEASEEEPRRIELLAAFLEQHSPEIVLIVVTTGERLAGLPVSSYDEAYASEDLAGVVRRIRAQDPRGMIRPFPKPRA